MQVDENSLASDERSSIVASLTKIKESAKSQRNRRSRDGKWLFYSPVIWQTLKKLLMEKIQFNYDCLLVN